MRGTPSRRPPKIADRETAPRSPAHAPATELSLSIGREGLGLELVKSVPFGPFRLTELSVDLPSLTFPLDVSGGVARFRHRRGVLRRMVLETDSEAIARWGAPRCAGILSSPSPELSASFHPGRVTLTLVAGTSDRDASFPPPLPAALAFDLMIEPRNDGLVVYVANARGVGLTQPASLLALRVARALFGAANAEQSGARFRLDRIAAHIARHVLPDAGARVPDASALRFKPPFADNVALILEGSSARLGVEEDVVDTRIKEAIELTTKADDALLADDHALARTRLLEALERAPKHPVVSLRIAEIDAAHGKRNVSALGLLRDLRVPVNAGSLEGDLLLAQGDRAGAMAAYAKEAEREESGPLAALIHAKAAALHPDPLDALVWLDFAVSRAPGRAPLRWVRVQKRLLAGKVEAALSDVEHLEAIAHGPREKFRVWLNAGRAWEEAGAIDEAGEMYENALRYSPDDPSALFGLGTSLVHRKRSARGIGLMVQAIELAESKRLPAATLSPMVLAVARALAEDIGDLPAAIARVRSIPRDTPESTLARGLEGRWRHTIGDLPGASLAFARMRDGVDQHDTVNVSDDIVSLLVEAGTFERDVKHDTASARRHFSTALSRRPGNDTVLHALQQLEPRPPVPSAPAPVVSAAAPALDPEARAEELIVQLKARPEDDAIVDELSDLLSTLGRGLELLALLSARLEDASPERRQVLIPKQRDVLSKLAREARIHGREQEAELYDMAKDSL